MSNQDSPKTEIEYLARAYHAMVDMLNGTTSIASIDQARFDRLHDCAREIAHIAADIPPQTSAEWAFKLSIDVGAFEPSPVLDALIRDCRSVTGLELKEAG